MLTSVKYITENFNNQIWNLGNHNGYDFEDYIHNVFANELKPYYAYGLRIAKTTRTRDDGIDIYIESPIAFSLMDINFNLKGKRKIKIVIECKATGHNKVSLEKFAKNILENNELDIDYFILATNGTIVPSAFYKSISEFEKNNCSFLLFDQFFLLKFLSNSIYDIPGNVLYIPSKNPIQLQYQLRKGRINGRNCFELYIDIRNYSNKPTNISFNLISNRNWNIENKLNTKLVPPHKGICIKLIAKRIYNDGIDDFKINVIYNNESKIVNIKNPEVVPDFQPPLSGKQHKRIINEIYNNLLNLSKSDFYYIYGEAGIGKTRIIDEIVKRVLDTDYFIVHILCNKRKKLDLEKDLCNELGVLGKNESNKIELFNYFNTHQFNRYLIVIEDLHNATEEFYEQLKVFTEKYKDIPCAFIIAGREDDTVYNESFFSFSSWLQKHIKSFCIEKFDEADCEMFIKSIIKDIPSIPLKKLINISSGNPFYIVQFVEYLLEIDFATLQNRNTVGLTNINTFSSQKYIPQKIEDLIKKRQKNLMKLENGDKCIFFLRMICLFGISIPRNIIVEYWGNENANLVELLFRKHYLSFDNNENIRFDHETIFIFYNNELGNKKNLIQICQLIVKKHSEILKYLPEFQRAKVFFYAKKFKESEELFKPILKHIGNTNNISSTNLLPEYFEYTDEVYELATKNNNPALQEKIIQASVYIPMHNMDYGTTISSIENALEKIKRNHQDNLILKNSILQLKAHTELTAAKLKQAEQIFLELIAAERLSPDYFSQESRFDLFDRTASLFTRYNHRDLAEKYNKLSEIVANELDDPKLISLSIMMKAKINFYSNTELSLHYMDQAHIIMEKDNAYRINCHNNVSSIGASILLSSNKIYLKYIHDIKKLLEEAIDNNYSFTIIRCNLLLAVLFYLKKGKKNIEISKKYIDDGINASIRYGCEKLMNYFYNLKAVISIKEGYPPEETLKYFDTMLEFLIKQNLLFLGNLDFCYGNIISLTNYAKFVYKYGDEQRLYQFLNKLSYYQSNKVCDFNCSERRNCYYSCNKNIDIFKKNIEKIEDKKLILIDSKYEYPLYDSDTGYYIVIH